MRILFALPYGPTLTRVRSRMLLRELSSRHDVTLLALAWGRDDLDAIAAHAELAAGTYPVPHGRAARACSLAGDPQRPLQQIASTSRVYARLARQLIAGAERRGAPFDAAHVEHLRGAAAIDLTRPLGARVVFDAVDCIAELARQTRRQGDNRLVRAVAAYEERRTANYEGRLLGAADAVTVVAERDRVALARHAHAEHVVVVPNGVEALDRPITLTADPRVIFTGKLSYHANQAALRWFLDHVWPLLRAMTPNATFVVAGADAPAWLRGQSGRGGVSLIENPAAMTPLIASARVAVAPMVYGVGIQNKMLEAMGCGTPVVATSAAADGLPRSAAGGFLLADDPAVFATRVATLFRDTETARRIGAAGHDYVTRHHGWSVATQRFEALYAGDWRQRVVA